MERSAALDAAREAVEQRDDNHGDPKQNFAVIATLWSTYLRHTPRPLDPHNVAEMMVLLKVARSANGRPQFDHHTDICGYATLAAYLAPAAAGEDDNA